MQWTSRVFDFDKTATGYNIGADVGILFTDNVGVGGIVRFSRATYDMSSALAVTAGAVDVSSLLKSTKAGGVFAAGGVRFRF